MAEIKIENDLPVLVDKKDNQTEIESYYNLVPIFAVFVNEEIYKDLKAGKRKKIDRKFSELQEDNLKKNHLVIENINGYSDANDDWFKSKYDEKQFAFLTKEFVLNLIDSKSESELENYSASLLSLNVSDMIVSQLSTDKELSTQGSFSQYTSLEESLNEYQDLMNIFNSINVNTKPQTQEEIIENEAVQEPDNDTVTETLEDETLPEQEENFVEDQSESEDATSSEYEQTTEPQSRIERRSIHVENLESDNDALREELKNRLYEIFSSSPVEAMNLDAVNNSTIPELNSINELSSLELKNIVTNTNAKLEELQNNRVNNLYSKILPVLNDNVSKIISDNEWKESDEYKNLIERANITRADIDIETDQFREKEQKLYDDAKQEYVDKKILEAREAFDRDNLSQFEIKVNNFKNEKVKNLESNIDDVVAQLKSKANENKENAFSSVVQQSIDQVLSDDAANYKKTIDTLTSEALEKMEAIIKSNSDKNKTILEKHAARRVDSEDELAKAKLSNDKNQGIIEFMKENHLVFVNPEDNEKNDEAAPVQTKTPKWVMPTIVALAASCLVTLVTSAFMVLSVQNKPVNQIVTPESATPTLNVKPENFKVGDTVKVREDGKLTDATVKSINDKSIIVQTKSGNEYSVMK